MRMYGNSNNPRQAVDTRACSMDLSTSLPHAKGSSVKEARKHPDEVEACKSVLDGPACIAGLKH